MSSFCLSVQIVTDIKKDGCNPEKGKYVPVTLRIDTVVENTSAFSLRAGDTVTVAEFSTWFKNEDGYTVSHQDGIIPITEEGAQHVIYIYEINETDENIINYYWTGLKYRVEALTIPIFQNSDLTQIEIYEALSLPDDVIQCSKDLIDHFVIE